MAPSVRTEVVSPRTRCGTCYRRAGTTRAARRLHPGQHARFIGAGRTQVERVFAAVRARRVADRSGSVTAHWSAGPRELRRWGGSHGERGCTACELAAPGPVGDPSSSIPCPSCSRGVTRRRIRYSMQCSRAHNCSMAEHDQSYKLLFSHREMVADPVRGFVREDRHYVAAAHSSTRLPLLPCW